jgi:hypothetical protein
MNGGTGASLASGQGEGMPCGLSASLGRLDGSLMTGLLQFHFNIEREQTIK